MGPVLGVLLDVDGTLVDSNDAHALAWVEAFAEAGRGVPFEKVRPLIGKGGDKLIRELVGLESEDPEGRRISDRRREIFKSRHLPGVAAFPRAYELLQRMRARKIRLVVASSATTEELGDLLDKCGARDLIESETSSDDASRSKPDPDIIHVALERLGLPPDQIAMLGDTPYDIAAASHACVRTIALRCGGWDDDQLDGAVAIYDDPADLLEKFDSSPIGQNPER